MRFPLVVAAAVTTLAVVACAASGHDETEANPITSADASAGSDAGPASDGGIGVCASTFGDRLTPGFGRIDGTLTAIVRPVVDEHCAQPNRDHVIVQVEMLGAVYRMVVNVQSDRDGGDTRVRIGRVDAPLPAPAWEEGWHTGVALDYATTLGQHTGGDGFTPLAMSPLVAEIVDELRVGEKISVYGFNGQGRPESAHKIHRNRFGTSTDGAIVVGATTASPRFLLFHFDGQTF